MALGPSNVARTITFSGGVAAASAKNSFETADIVARADAALYRAKRGGRDRIELEQPA
jgi:PleD family two-component response regulator